jgi:hypothetical protein
MAQRAQEKRRFGAISISSGKKGFSYPKILKFRDNTGSERNGMRKRATHN